jgi:hypothetical protein
MKDPVFQVVASGTQNPETNNLDPFTPENLRLDQNFTETVGVKKLLTTIPIRKPGKQVFFRVRPDSEGKTWREMLPIIDLKDDREEYIVMRRCH